MSPPPPPSSLRATRPVNVRRRLAMRPGRTRPADDIIEAKRVFVAEFAKRANVADACRAAGVGRAFYYAWRDIDPLFLQAVEAAREHAYDAMEREAHRRAFEGVDMPAINKDGVIFHPQTGQQVFIRQFSDFLADKLLRANRPDKFGNKLEVKHTEVGRATDGDLIQQLQKLGVNIRTGGVTIEGKVAKDIDEAPEQRDPTIQDNIYLVGAEFFEEPPGEDEPNYFDDTPTHLDDSIARIPPPPPRDRPVPMLPPTPPLASSTTPVSPLGEEGIDW